PPCRAARCAVENLPKPVNETESPRFKVSVTESRKASTAFAESRFERPLLDAPGRQTPASSLAHSSQSLGSCRRLATLQLPRESRNHAGLLALSVLGGVLQELGGPKERHEADVLARQSLGSALLTIDDADGFTALQP